MGGLTTASVLAQVGRQRVLVLESHFKLGGFLHSFRRGDFVWDPGVHYVGEMHERSLARRCMDLVTGGRVRWHKLDHEFERFLFPDETVAVPACPRSYREQLIARFPKEIDGISRYFRDLRSVQRWSRRWFASKQFTGPLRAAISWGRRLPSTRTQDYMDSHFRDPKLKAILTGQWMDYGAPPSRSAFGIHALIAADFQDGGYYPVGGSQAIVDHAAKRIEQQGGRCLINHPVKEILIENNRAIGVRVKIHGETSVFTAPRIVSNAGVDTTFNRLVPPECGQIERNRIRRCERGTSAMVLYLGLNDDPRRHGFQDCNYWLFPSADHNRHASPGSMPPAFVSFGSLRNPGQTPHTCQVVTLSQEEHWSEFSDSTWKRRGDEYEKVKESSTRRLLSYVEERLPGLSRLVDFAELSSPLTVKSFLGHVGGQIYGQECSPTRLGDGEWSIGTSVKNLYLTGTDVAVPGVNSALMVGVMTAGKLLGPLGMPRILSASRSVKPAKD